MSKTAALALDENAAENDDENACVIAPVVVKKMASLLVKPKVSLVSLVGHAANGLAFGIVKDEDGQTPSTPTTQEPDTMPKAATPIFGSPGATLNRIEFDLNIFKTEEDVQKHLTANSITAKRILKTDTHFVVPGVHEDSLEGIEMVKGEADGVAYFIGKIKAPVAAKITPPSPGKGQGGKVVPIVKGEPVKAPVREDGDENEHELVFKTEMAPEFEEVIQKMDTYIARQIGTQTLDETMGTGDVELPGLYMLTNALEVTIRNIVTKAEPADIAPKIKAAFARAGEIATGLAGVFVTIQKSEDKEVPSIDRDKAVAHFSSPKPEAIKKAEGEGEVQKPADTPAPAASASPDAITAAVEVALKKSLEPLTQQVTTIGGAVEEVKKSVDDRLASIEGRVVTVEEVHQVRKSLPDDGEATPVQKSEKDKQEEIRKAERLQKEEAERQKDAEFERTLRLRRLGHNV